MAKRKQDDMKFETGTSNVFADLGLPDAEKLKIKSGLVIEITRAMTTLGATQSALFGLEIAAYQHGYL